MARAKNPQRDEARNRWIESGGTLPTKENAALSGATESQVRKWKSLDKWADELGGMGTHGGRGNANAKGSGAPERNTNAATHGANVTMHLDSLTPGCKAYVEGIGGDSSRNMLRELQLLYAKEYDLKDKIRALENEPPGVLHVEKHVETDNKKSGKTTTIESASAFEHIMRLKDMEIRIHGRILKLLDSMKGYELEKQRLDLEERKYRLAKQKLSGEYSVDAATGEIIDSAEAEVEKVVDEALGIGEPS
jgi:hypothetical protein